MPGSESGECHRPSAVAASCGVPIWLRHTGAVDRISANRPQHFRHKGYRRHLGRHFVNIYRKSAPRRPSCFASSRTSSRSTRQSARHRSRQDSRCLSRRARGAGVGAFGAVDAKGAVVA
eukprot:6180813-Pleurochrysis_carterae.AAC.2